MLLFRQQADGALDESDLIQAQYEKKEDLLTLYKRKIKEITKFRKDLEIAPKKVFVSLRRSKQFEVVQLSTKTRMDLGLNLCGVEPEGVLIGGEKWGGMCTHWIELTQSKDINHEVITWLKKAYEMA